MHVKLYLPEGAALDSKECVYTGREVKIKFYYKYISIMKKFLYIFILLFIVGWAQAQQRVVYTINDGWKFTKGSPFEAQLARL